MNTNNFFKKYLVTIIITFLIITSAIIGFYQIINNKKNITYSEFEYFDKNIQNEINLTNEKIQDFRHQLFLLEKELEPKLINSSQYFIKKVEQDEIVHLTEIEEFEKKNFDYLISRIQSSIENIKFEIEGYLCDVEFDLSQKTLNSSKVRMNENLLDIKKYLNELKNNINNIKTKFKTNSKNFEKIKTYVCSTKNDKNLLPSNLTEEEKKCCEKLQEWYDPIYLKTITPEIIYIVSSTEE